MKPGSSEFTRILLLNVVHSRKGKCAYLIGSWANKVATDYLSRGLAAMPGRSWDIVQGTGIFSNPYKVSLSELVNHSSSITYRGGY